jgi:hypothetical protein
MRRDRNFVGRTRPIVPEAELIKRLRDDDDTALLAIFDLYFNDVFDLATSILLVRYSGIKALDMAKRAASRVFDEFWDDRHNLNGSTNLKSTLSDLTWKITAAQFFGES